MGSKHEVRSDPVVQNLLTARWEAVSVALEERERGEALRIDGSGRDATSMV
jgi:hypothetical protein